MKLEIEYSFGYVFDKSKLIVMCPVGSLEMDSEEYEMEVEVAFLEDGIYDAFSEEDINFANESIEPLKMYLYKPNKIIPFVTNIKNSETKEELPKMLEEFDEEYELKSYYIEKGYKFNDLISTCENIKEFIPNENLETLRILKIEKEKFDLEKLINTCNQNLGENILTKMKKSDLTNRLFVEGNDCSFISFGVYSENKLKIATNEIFENFDFDMGDLEINKNFGYLVEENEGFYSIKIGSSTKTPNGNFLVQLVDYSGNFKKIMIEFLDNFKK